MLKRWSMIYLLVAGTLGVGLFAISMYYANDHLTAELGLVRADANNAKAEIARLQGMLADAKAENEKLSRELTAGNTTVSQREQTLSELKEKVAALEKSLASADQSQDELRKQLSESRTQLKQITEDGRTELARERRAREVAENAARSAQDKIAALEKQNSGSIEPAALASPAKSAQTSSEQVEKTAPAPGVPKQTTQAAIKRPNKLVENPKPAASFWPWE
jgi:chromosome segregation ATPase